MEKFERKSKKFIHFNKDNSKGLKNNSVFDICETQTGEFWIGTYDGLYLFNRRKDEFKCYQHNPSDPNSIVNNFIRKIYEDHTGVLWICTDRGFDRYDIKSNKFFHLKTESGVHFDLNEYPILSILEDKSENMWIGTTVGLFKLLRNVDNASAIKFLRYSIKDGLPDNNIQAIIDDNKNNLWISTNKGLSKFVIGEGTFKNFNMNNGLPSDEFYVNSYEKRKKTAELLFGGVKGFTIFRPDEIKDDSFIAPIVFTDFRISNQPIPVGKKIDGNIILPKSITENSQITLSYKNSIVSFEFALLHFAAPSGNLYAYMMEGLETKWNYIGNKRNATYTFLPPGEYNLIVKASNSSGVWNEKGTSLKIIVNPPVWKMWWFRISAGIILLFIASIIYKIHVSTIEKSRNQLEKLNEQLSEEIKERHQKEIELRKAKDEAEKSDKLKSEFLAQMSHEIRTPINAILSFASLLKDEISGKIPEDLNQSFTIINRAGNRLIRTIDLILNMSQLQTNTYECSFKYFNIYDKVLKGLAQQHRKTANDKGVDLYLNNESDDTLVYADEYTVTQIFDNLINNAIKFTRQGKVDINLKREEEKKLIIEVSDTGVGISDEFLPNLFKPFTQEEAGYTRRFEGNGLGLALVKKYVELNNAEIYMKSKKGIGTVFTILFHQGENYD